MNNHTGMKNNTNVPDDKSCAPTETELNEFRQAVSMLMGKWKIEILWILFPGPLRFGEVRKALPGITQHMLTAQLRALEADRLITRTSYAEIPPRVEYALTENALALKPVFLALTEWAQAIQGTEEKC
ncbi:winged helix-turn-helix transcriptional regulator [Serratia proteamaculans]|uniref:winged helix-turn-helix transcriptional regulator n=1 Tax=Serratia proteamaculans TaxID=28151 RepID=UPI0039BEBC7B